MGVLLGGSSQEWAVGLRVKIRKKLFLVVVFQAARRTEAALPAPIVHMAMP